MFMVLSFDTVVAIVWVIGATDHNSYKHVTGYMYFECVHTIDHVQYMVFMFNCTLSSW